jgi:hypothetical protein
MGPWPRIFPRRHRCLSVRNGRREMTRRCQTWRAILGTAMAAYRPNKESSSHPYTRRSPQGALLEPFQAGHAGNGHGEAVTGAGSHRARQAGEPKSSGPLESMASRAPHGVRGLGELPECRRHGLEAWRQPFEESVIYIQSRGRLECQCLGYVCGLCCAHQFAQPHVRDVSGLSGFARGHRASANPANSSLELECFESPAYSSSPYSRLNSASISSRRW